MILMRHGPPGAPAEAFILVKLGLHTGVFTSTGRFPPFLGVGHISILTIVNRSVVISDFRLSRRRVSHDMITLINHTALLGLCGKLITALPSWPTGCS